MRLPAGQGIPPSGKTESPSEEMVWPSNSEHQGLGQWLNCLKEWSTLALSVDRRDGRLGVAMEKGTRAPSETKMALADEREAPSGKKECTLEVGVQVVEEDGHRPWLG